MRHHLLLLLMRDGLGSLLLDLRGHVCHSGWNQSEIVLWRKQGLASGCQNLVLFTPWTSSI
jgi:hypothetical protein